jgi:DNA-binding GntR family transcriptional regulator
MCLNKVGDSAMKKLPTYKTKKDFVVEILREAILSGALKPGERLEQEQLANHFEVSSTPVREALRQLEAEGLIEHIPHKGVRVVELSVEDVREVYMIRGVLETLAVRLAVPNLSHEELRELEELHEQMVDLLSRNLLEQLGDVNRHFHMTLYKASKSRVLCDMINNLWTRLPWFDVWTVIPGRAQEAWEEHDKIMDAARKRDPDLASDMIKEHCERGCQRVADHIQKLILNSD